MRHFERGSRHGIGRRGANAVEFALTLPILIFILSGVVDYSWYLHRQYVIINAVSQGARAGATTPQADSPEAVAISVANETWTASELSGFPTFNAVREDDAPDQLLRVTGSQPFTALVGILPVPAQNNHETVMRMDQQPGGGT